MTISPTRARNYEELQDSLGVIADLLQDETVEDVNVNANEALFCKRRGMAPEHMGSFPEDRTLNIIHIVAHLAGTVIHYDRPVLETVLPEGPFRPCRFSGLVPPRTSGPSFSIRTRPSSVIPLREYLSSGVITDQQYDVILQAVHHRWNILVVGATGSGKTTFASSVLHEIATWCPDDRIVTIEDTPEIVCSSLNKLELFALNGATMVDCVKDALRQVPDRLVVGEVRDGAAWAMLDAWHTGHGGGVATVHGESAHEGLKRIVDLVPSIHSREATESLVKTAIQVVAFIKRDNTAPSGRRLTELRVTARKGE